MSETEVKVEISGEMNVPSEQQKLQFDFSRYFTFTNKIMKSINYAYCIP